KQNRNYYTIDIIGTSPKKEKILANNTTTFKTGSNIQYPLSRLSQEEALSYILPTFKYYRLLAIQKALYQ
ncbi:17112_t:CDS:2, partial [Racocetra persica]